jgi:deoxyribodipyrimidine photolyase-related protein
MILRLILGDQLNRNHSWFDQKRDDVIYVMMEIKQETTYVKHHIQKVVGFFLAMRNFAGKLKEDGHKIHYIKIDDRGNGFSFADNLTPLIKKYKANRFEYQEPDEYRLDQQLKKFCEGLDLPSEMVSTEHFLTERDDISRFFEGKKMLLMESFYRHMRKKHDILMDRNGRPLGGEWNYDKENRNKLPKGMEVPEPFSFRRDVREMVDTINKEDFETFGRIDPSDFTWPVNREESLQLLDHFTGELLPYFGTYQDAMAREHWSLFHSRLSFSLNSKMLHPLEVIEKTIDTYENRSNHITLSQVEGFVRQILGWREYMRGIYWKEMPEYASLNFFGHERVLPSWYWTGKTKMGCLEKSIKQSLDHAYAHHIQRLMVTGNFALLAGISPDETDRWYLGIYMDAIEWVEITNTRGMSQFADGGIVGTKPYVSSARYIDKMSDYCSGCHYDKKDKTGEKACPFNSLYWRFYQVNRDKLERNPRIGMMYRTWDKMSAENRDAILSRASDYLNRIEEL